MLLVCSHYLSPALQTYNLVYCIQEFLFCIQVEHCLQLICKACCLEWVIPWGEILNFSLVLIVWSVDNLLIITHSGTSDIWKHEGTSNTAEIVDQYTLLFLALTLTLGAWCCSWWQIVPTSTNEAELCINGMSFSKRSSRWANAALVVTVSANDFSPLIANHGPLAGIAFQV